MNSQKRSSLSLETRAKKRKEYTNTWWFLRKWNMSQWEKIRGLKKLRIKSWLFSKSMKVLESIISDGIHFLEPIDIEALKIPHYPKIVSKPMDFSTIKTKLTLNAYDSETDFYDDMCLVFDNCMLFNGRESSYGRIAFELKCEFDSMYKR